MSEFELFGTVISHLPKDVDLRHITAHVRVRCAPNRSWGETYILMHKDQLILLARASVLDGYELLDLDQSTKPSLVQGSTQSDLFLTGKDGQRYRLPIAPDEIDNIRRFLDRA